MTAGKQARVEASDDDVGASQLDVATSFLAILLLYLVIMVVVSIGQGRGSANSSYIRDETTTSPISLRTFRYVYPFQDLWLVQNARAARVDLALLAERIAANDGNEFDVTFPDGTRVVATVNYAGAPSGFVLRLYRPLHDSPPEANEGPFDLMIPLASGQIPSDRAIGAISSGALFLVWREDISAAFPLLGALQRSGKNPQIAEVNDLCNGRWCPGIRREPSGFALEEVFR